MIPLKDIKYVLLDMDGTLLDKYFDDYFWEHLVPERYAERHDLSFGRAKEELLSKYKAHEGTLNWTDIDFWSRELKLDIPALKEQIRHLIDVHPHVIEFLSALKKHRKKVYMVTNAHYKVLDLKLKKTDIGKYFDKCITSNELGHPKENIEFWKNLEKVIHFEKEKTLFIDDLPEILETARYYGIRYLLHKTRASSRKGDSPHSGFTVIRDFGELINSF
ncbi:MAG TPA: HAD-IA family hydrolase [Dissulfurispiraceae bacterium]|nr:HAD-IA family hydrolase [Dissulfurispiraceae bacterium]